jgi:putative transcriptional regulator
MNNAINFHPDAELLEEFAQGRLPAGLSVAVSAHVELCEECRDQTSRAEAKASVDWLQSPERKSSEDFSHLIAGIVGAPQQKESVADVCPVNEIRMPGHSVTLPRALAGIASEGLVWKKLVGGINQAQVILDDESQCEFIYMKPGSQVPVHKHQGNEITLVLDGSFSDELGHYKVSDFIIRDRDQMHQPASEAGCLCFAVLDGPLAFTRGIARLLNPLNRYRFRRATAQRS